MKIFNSFLIKASLTLAGFLITVTSGFSQLGPGVFFINSPSGIGGAYEIGTADWGAPYDMEWTGDLEFVIDSSDIANSTLACNDTSIYLQNDLTGKIAFADRGACNFSLKALNAERKGAIGVIICNHTAGAGVIPMGGGALGPLVTVPVMMLSYEDCQEIRMVMDSEPVNATMAGEIIFANDLALIGPTHAPNFQTPVLHNQEVPFSGAFTNKGSVAQTNVMISTEVFDGNGMSIHTGNGSVPSMNPGDTIPYPPFVMGYMPPDCVGDYVQVHSLTADLADDFGLDNEANNPFSITQSTFAKANAASGGTANALGGTYEFGNFYELLAADSAASITFGISKNAADGPLEGESLTLYLLRVDCDLNDPACTDNFNDSQITPIGVAFYTVPAGTANYDPLTADLLDFNTFASGPLPLDPGVYMALVSITGNGVDNTIFVGRGNNVYADGQLASVVREGGALDVAGGGGTWFLAGFGQDTPAFVNLNVTSGGDATSCLVTGIAPVERLEADINLFPNPASKEITMSLDLPTGITEAEIKISDIMGRVIDLRHIDQQSVTMVFNLDQLAQGTYFLTVIADGGKLITKRFAVTR